FASHHRIVSWRICAFTVELGIDHAHWISANRFRMLGFLSCRRVLQIHDLILFVLPRASAGESHRLGYAPSCQWQVSLDEAYQRGRDSSLAGFAVAVILFDSVGRGEFPIHVGFRAQRT